MRPLGSRLAELRSCVKVEVASWAPVLNKPTVSVDVKQHFNNNNSCSGTLNDKAHKIGPCMQITEARGGYFNAPDTIA